MNSPEDIAQKPIVLYDGLCGFCTLSVQEILRYDKEGKIYFATLSSGLGKAVLERHPVTHGEDTVVLVEGLGSPEEKVYLRSEAVLKIAAHLGGPFKLLLVTRIFPRPLLDVYYKFFAKIRYRVFGKRESCLIPSAEERARFLDLG